MKKYDGNEGIKKYIEELIKKYSVEESEEESEEKKFMKDLMKKYDIEEKPEEGKSEYGINIDGLSKGGLNINGLDKNGYNINGIDKNGVDKNGLNINGIEGNRTKYPKRRIRWTDNEGVYYDQYGEKGLKKDLIKMVMIYMDLMEKDLIKMG